MVEGDWAAGVFVGRRSVSSRRDPEPEGQTRHPNHC